MTEQDFAAVFSGTTGVIYGICCLVACIIGLVASIKIFQKAGKPGWHAIIPILNLYDEFDFAWGNGIMFLLLLIPIVNCVISIMFAIKLARSFGKGGGFAAGLIFLSPIFMLILAFGSAEYIGPNGEADIPSASVMNDQAPPYNP